MVKTYDSKCYELAKLFLEDAERATHENCDLLALAIQQVIEDFITFIDCDPTLWCNWCGAKTREQCDCGQIDPMN